MDAITTSALSRQLGLWREMSIVANNIANSSTTGFRQEGLIFSEFIKSEPGGRSLSMAHGNTRNTSFLQGPMSETGGTLDFAIEGDGFFLVETPAGERLTRAGSFAVSAEGNLVTPQGYNVLDPGGAPIFVPPDAGPLSVARDGTLSAGDRLLGQIAMVVPTAARDMVRETGVLFDAPEGYAPSETSRLLQGFTEGANVNPVAALTRMIEVQRAYELGQSFLDAEHQRTRDALTSFTK